MPALSATVAFALAGCSASGSDHFSIGGSVSGLADGSQLTLQDNGTDSLTVSANGPFTFATAIPANDAYNITISAQPSGQTCSVASNSGSGSGVVANVTSVSVVCSASTYTVGGSVTGLANGATLTLQDNGADPLTVSANGPFTFDTPIPLNGSYAVTVANQPAGQTCSVAQASGAGVVANIATVAVTCSNSGFTLSGQVAGLTSNQQVTLLNNGADPVTVSANGGFSFPALVAQGGNYSVTVGTQPTQQTCSVSAGSGSAVSANVSNVAVNCSDSGYTVGGSLTGMADNTQITLKNNGADPLTLTANGSFTFNTGVVTGSPYTVTVDTPPRWQDCALTNGSGTATANVVNVGVACSPTTATTIGSGFNYPMGVAVDAAGNVYVADYYNNAVKKIAPNNGPVTTIGSGFSYPTGVAVDAAGNVYVADYLTSAVKQIAPNNGPVTTIGSGFHNPTGVAVDAAGNVYVADYYNYAVKQIAPNNGPVTTIGSEFTRPSGVAIDAAGNLYVADSVINAVKVLK